MLVALVITIALIVVVLTIVWWLTGGVAPPEALEVQQTGRDLMADVLVYKVSVGPVVDADVVERQLAVVVDGLEQPESRKVFPASATDLGEIRVPQDASVELSLVDVDDAGNRSEPAVFEFVAVDTLPPAAPGAFGVTLVAEEEQVVEPAAPEAPVEPEAPVVEPEAPSDEI
jgi:hypothetical protein